MSDKAEKSPLAVFREHCAKGELAYQVTKDGEAIYYPRIVAPVTGGKLDWKVSKGLGTVYATTTVYPRKGDPYDVSLIDIDEGFRMMSRVEKIEPMKVKIGMRVKVRMIPATEKEPVYPVFDPVEGA
ncbi:MAG: hypothetical protein GEU87_12560 [Alphaproteobacteria bacterium]|nr:hypothetical protein [Alphaproteobacteria bacterium]